jgi:hypothetical protein
MAVTAPSTESYNQFILPVGVPTVAQLTLG